jgi:hypothetical protein
MRHRAWKGFDWDVLNRLYEKGFIGDPVNKTKSAVFTDEGRKTHGPNILYWLTAFQRARRPGRPFGPETGRHNDGSSNVSSGSSGADRGLARLKLRMSIA